MQLFSFFFPASFVLRLKMDADEIRRIGNICKFQIYHYILHHQTSDVGE